MRTSRSWTNLHCPRNEVKYFDGGAVGRAPLPACSRPRGAAIGRPRNSSSASAHATTRLRRGSCSRSHQTATSSPRLAAWRRHRGHVCANLSRHRAPWLKSQGNPRPPASSSAHLPLRVRASVRPAHGSRKRRRTNDHDPQALEFPHASQHHRRRPHPVPGRDHCAGGRRVYRGVDRHQRDLQFPRRSDRRPALRCRGQQGRRRPGPRRRG